MISDQNAETPLVSWEHIGWSMTSPHVTRMVLAIHFIRMSENHMKHHMISNS